MENNTKTIQKNIAEIPETEQHISDEIKSFHHSMRNENLYKMNQNISFYISMTISTIALIISIVLLLTR